MLTIARMHSESVAYYESTVDAERAQNLGPGAYYSEDGTRPAEAWIVARTDDKQAAVAEFLGTEPGAELGGETVQKWFNRALAPGGNKLGRRPGERGVPGFDLTFCAPKSVSLVWGLSESEATREAVNQAHAKAVSTALAYLAEHAGYTRRASDWDPAEMVIDRVEALSGAKYEHRTSRSGDPHVHSHVLVSNRQLCADGKVRSLDSKSLFHEARAAGMLYQSVLRSTLSETLGVEWSEVTNGCAEITGLDDPETIKAFSTRMREIDLWRAENGLESDSGARMGQKITRRVKDTDTSLEELHRRWNEHEQAAGIRAAIAGFSPRDVAEAQPSDEVSVPTAEDVVAAVIAERSTFTRADLVEKAAEMLPVGAVATDRIHTCVEAIVDEVLDSGAAWSVNPDAARSFTQTAREGSQRFTAEPVVEEINRGIDLATATVDRGVDASSIQPVEGQLSANQAEAMRQVVASRYRSSVVVAPAGAGKTSSLKAARKAWERSGKTVVGLAPTGKASDVMVREDVAHSSATIARALIATEDLEPDQVAARLGWNRDTVVVVDEAGMVATPQVVRLLEVTEAADARIIFVGDPHQYAAVKARSGMLATLAYELPDTAELSEVFRQKDQGERIASQWLRNGDETSIKRAANWYAQQGRLHAGSTSAMLTDALAGWITDQEAGHESLLVASTREDVDALNAGAQQLHLQDGAFNPAGPKVRLAGEQRGYVGEVILTRRNDYQLTTSAGDVVRNGQRWQIEQIHMDGSLTARRRDETQASVVLPASYVAEHVQLGYASTGHAAQGATVDVCRVVAGIGQVDRAGVYVPMTRGREANHLYLMDTQPGDPDTAHYHLLAEERRDATEDARDLLVQAAKKDRADVAPHQVWRAAKQDFELARLSSNQRIDITPFTGTRMAEVMAERHVKRRERFEDYYRRDVDTTTPQHPAPEKPTSETPERPKAPEEIVAKSLATRLLADVRDVLLKDVLESSAVVHSTYLATRNRHHELAERQAGADQAQVRMPELEEQYQQLDDQHQGLLDQKTRAEGVLQAERNRSKIVKLLRGGGAERAAREQVADIHAQLEQVRRARSQAGEELREQHRMIARAPDTRELEETTNRLAELTLLVRHAQTPEVVQAELAWRRDAPREVAEVDRARRQPASAHLPVADELARRHMGSPDDFLRNLDTHVDRYQESQGSNSSWQPSGPGLDRDQGLDL